MLLHAIILFEVYVQYTQEIDFLFSFKIITKKERMKKEFYISIFMYQYLRRRKNISIIFHLKRFKWKINFAKRCEAKQIVME